MIYSHFIETRKKHRTWILPLRAVRDVAILILTCVLCGVVIMLSV